MAVAVLSNQVILSGLSQHHYWKLLLYREQNQVILLISFFLP
jgi:hypothetical protein